MNLLCSDMQITIDECHGRPNALVSLGDPYQMNWIRSDYPWGKVNGFHFVKAKKTENGISVWAENEDGTLSLAVKRFVKGEKYCEEYSFQNVSSLPIVISEETVGIAFPYNDLFDKKEHMLHTRCNSHVWCADSVCRIHSVKLDGEKPYLIQKAICGSFEGYGLLCDICASPNASFDRGSIVLYPKRTVLKSKESISLAFEFYFSDKRERFSPVFSDKYSGFINEEFSLFVNWEEPIRDLSACCDGKKIAFDIDNKTACAKVTFADFGEKQIDFTINGKKTFIRLNVLRALDEILESRVRYITEKQQYTGENERLRGAYLIYDREREETYYSNSFCDHNEARERLSMGALVALSLSKKYDARTAGSLRKHREFIEREILNIKAGHVRNGIDDDLVRLYNYPWVSTYYLEWYRFSKEKECLLIAARVLLTYYALGGENQESPCIEAFDILAYLKAEGFGAEYEALKEKFIAHGNSIHKRKTSSSSGEVACANGMMNLMGTFLFQVYLITKDEKYLENTPMLLKIAESFYDLQPDAKMHGIALRYWDMYWFGKEKSYGDTYPQWLSALTAQLYYYCDRAIGTDHVALIRENLLGNCCLYFPDGSAACGYLYPKSITVFSSELGFQNKYRPQGVWHGEHYDAFANDQDWSLYYAVKYLMDSV